MPEQWYQIEMAGNRLPGTEPDYPDGTRSSTHGYVQMRVPQTLEHGQTSSTLPDEQQRFGREHAHGESVTLNEGVGPEPGNGSKWEPMGKVVPVPGNMAMAPRNMAMAKGNGEMIF